MDPNQAKIQINKMFLDVLSNVSGGFVVDMTTAITAMLVIAVVLLGIDVIVDVLLPSWEAGRAENRLREAAKDAGLNWDKLKKKENLINARQQWRKYGRKL